MATTLANQAPSLSPYGPSAGQGVRRKGSKPSLKTLHWSVHRQTAALPCLGSRVSDHTLEQTYQVTNFAYNGDGARVKKMEQVGSVITTTFYAGAIEVLSTVVLTPQLITKTYYSAGGQMMAMREALPRLKPPLNHPRHRLPHPVGGRAKRNANIAFATWPKHPARRHADPRAFQQRLRIIGGGDMLR